MSNTKSVLFKTSAATDVQCSGGDITITGQRSVNKKDITSIKQVNYRAEVAQVVTIGATSYTPTASTIYAVEIYDPNRRQNGQQEQPKIYPYETPPVITTLGATAALQREAIHLALIAKINADGSNKSVAATLATGTGFTVTDDGSYYPARSQSMSQVLGANVVLPRTNSDGTGFASTNYVITTAAVTSFGVGANLLAEKPSVDLLYGNLISGSFDAPLANDGTGAVTGQKYDMFEIDSLEPTEVGILTGKTVYKTRTIKVYVDNGTGSATTNLDGFKAIERVFHKLMVGQYRNDASTVQEWFDKPIVFQDPLGAAPTGTADTLGWQLSPYGSLNRTNIGTQTIVVPVLAAAGLLLDQDDTAGDGSHTSANQQALGDQSFIVGKTPFMVVGRAVAGDWTDTQFMVGFRKKAVYAANYDNYTDLASIGGGAADGDSVTTQGILNNAATISTDTAVNFTDAVSSLLMVKVDISGNVTCYFNGTKYPVYSAGTTPLVFDAGDEMIPFYQHVNIGGGDPTITPSEFFAVATDQLIS